MNETFIVIDKNTGKEANEAEIALHEEWAKRLCYCDMEGFFVGEEGTIILCDECGNFEYVPEGRFNVVHKSTPIIEIDGKKYVADDPKLKTVHGKTGEVVIGGFKEVIDNE